MAHLIERLLDRSVQHFNEHDCTYVPLYRVCQKGRTGVLVA
jgi:hypothetical protein